MLNRLIFAIVMGLMVIFGSTAHEFDDKHCKIGSFWGGTDWDQVQVGDESANVAKHCVIAHFDETEVENVKIKTALNIVTLDGNTHIMTLLLENGVDVNAQDDDHNTALHYAVRENNLKAAEILVSYGADVNIVSEYIYKENRIRNRHHREFKRAGYTPLHIAAVSGHKSIAKLLVDSGSTIDKCSKDDGTPLHIATKNGRNEIVEILIDAGAQVNAVTGELGVTPLYIAVDEETRTRLGTSTNYGKSCELLAGAGANLHALPVRARASRYFEKRSPIQILRDSFGSGRRRGIKGPCFQALEKVRHNLKRKELMKPSLDCYKINQSRDGNTDD